METHNHILNAYLAIITKIVNRVEQKKTKKICILHTVMLIWSSRPVERHKCLTWNDWHFSHHHPVHRLVKLVAYHVLAFHLNRTHCRKSLLTRVSRTTTTTQYTAKQIVVFKVIIVIKYEIYWYDTNVKHVSQFWIIEHLHIIRCVLCYPWQQLWFCSNETRVTTTISVTAQ